MAIPGGEGSNTGKLVEALQAELRSLSNEAKKRYPQIKDAAESCIERLRNFSTRTDTSFIQGLFFI